MSDLLQAEELEQRAKEQRQRFHNTVTELRNSVRECMDLEQVARQHLGSISAGVGIVALVLGYGVTKSFTNKR